MSSYVEEDDYAGAVVVKFYSDIRGVVDTDSMMMKIEGCETVGDLIVRLCRRFPDSFSRIIYEPNTKKVNSSVSIFLNRVNIAFLDDVNTGLKDGDEVLFFAAVSGG